MTETMTCTQCETEKPLDEMVKNSHCLSGYSSCCKQCKREYSVEYRKGKRAKDMREKQIEEGSEDEDGNVTCQNCLKKMRPEAAMQPPLSVQRAGGGKVWCSNCANTYMTDDIIRKSTEVEYKVPSGLSPETKARTVAVKKLIEKHRADYLNILRQEKITFGVPHEPGWTSASDVL